MDGENVKVDLNKYKYRYNIIQHSTLNCRFSCNTNKVPECRREGTDSARQNGGAEFVSGRNSSQLKKKKKNYRYRVPVPEFVNGLKSLTKNCKSQSLESKNVN